MGRIWFFSIPAHGHVNPTLAVVRELTSRGHTVRYYETEEFRAKIEAAGAEFVSIEPYMPPARDDIDKVAGKDFAALIEMVADTTIGLDARIAEDVKNSRPDVIVYDSVCFWGRLLAKKHGIPAVCSTTTMAFNKETAKLMKQGIGEMLRMMIGMPRIEKKMQLLRAHGYNVESFVSVIGNEETTDTIVYTSSMFQPSAELFGDRYVFVGPTAARVPPVKDGRKRPQVYVSLGTVLSHNPRFYRACVRALGEMDVDAILSVGQKTDITSLGVLPENVRVYPRVDQMEVLAGSDVFLTHCGMNSVQESLLSGVPMVLYPQHSEERAVAIRAEQLGAGVMLKRATPRGIKKAIEEALENSAYRENAMRIREDFLACGGAEEAAGFIERKVNEQEGYLVK